MTDASGATCRKIRRDDASSAPSFHFCSHNLAPDVGRGDMAPVDRREMRARSRFSVAMSLVMIGLGLAFLARTAAAGGGQVGILLGLGFLIAGLGRLYIERRR